MDERYQRAKELFLSVCDLAATKRREVLDLECAGDAELRAEVQSLLVHHAEPPTVELPPAAADRKPAAGRKERAPETVGPYRIIREIGRGGMGVVYLGAREGDHFRRLAAVKILKRGMDTQEILKRFEHERQVLAALNHHGIARLYDAGETADGLPFFAMEYIDGQPIDVYCDTHRLRITERLDLFRQVCAAVQYVHQNLMVHRDLKPSNILVTADGVPKLLDFGIAKIINPELSLFGGDPTLPEMRIMTPEYASPEQVRGSPITVASDIYALGVILYELVTGHRPYRIEGRVRAEIERVICAVDPERPSTAASRVEVIEAEPAGTGPTTTITPETVAMPREGRPERLRRRLAGDIDNIVLMAMRKEPQRRYQSAEQFREDLRRHVDGLPVIARKDTPGYRLAKFVRRHRGGVAAAAVVTVALLGWGVTAAYGWAAERHHAQVTRRMLDEVLELAHVFVFDFHDRIRRLDGSLPARKLLAQTAQECLEDLKPDVGDDPRLRRDLAAAYDRVGTIWADHRSESLGNTEMALANFRTAMAMREALLDCVPDDPELRYDVAVSHLHIGDVLRFTGEVKGAWEEYEKYLLLTRALMTADPRYRRPFATALGTAGSVHKDLGQLEDARRFYEQSLDVRRQVLAARPDDVQAIEDMAVGYVHVGEALALLEDDEGALAMYRESIKSRARVVADRPDDGSSRRFLALSHYYSADVLLRLGRHDDAAPHVEEAVALIEKRAESNTGTTRASLQDLALAREIQGRLLAARGDHEGALRRYEEWKALAADFLAKNREHTVAIQLLAESNEHIGEARLAIGDVPGALGAYREALDTIRPAAAKDNADKDFQLLLARIQSAFGGALIEAGDAEAARIRLEEARSIQESVLEASPKHARAKRGLEQTRGRQSHLAVERDSAQGPTG